MSLNDTSASAQTLKVPLSELASIPSPRKKRRKSAKRHAMNVVMPLISNILARYSELTSRELLVRVRMEIPDYTQSAMNHTLSKMYRDGIIDHGAKHGMWRATSKKAATKIAAPASKVVKVTLKAPAEMSDVEKVVSAAVAQVEDAVNALKALGVSLVERAKKIEEAKKLLAEM